HTIGTPQSLRRLFSPLRTALGAASDCEFPPGTDRGMLASRPRIHRTPEEERPTMRFWNILALLVVGCIATVLGCSQEPRVHIEVETDKPSATVPVAETPASQAPLVQTEERIIRPRDLPSIELTVQEKYDAALLDALNQLTDKKFAEAVAALEAARALRDT